MSSTTRLLVLGVVRLFQPVHGYDVRRELVSWHAEEWANVAPGSIYSALKTLERDGLVEVMGTNQVGARPERTTYQITPRGNAEMMELLRETLWQVQAPVDPLVSALSMMSFLDRKEMISALEARAHKIQGNLAHNKMLIDAIDDVETPMHVRAMMKLLDARLAAELAWSAEFRADLAAGKYRTKGDPGWMPVGIEGAAKPSIPSGDRDVRSVRGGKNKSVPPAPSSRGTKTAVSKSAAKATATAKAALRAVAKIDRAKSAIAQRDTARAESTRAAVSRVRAATRTRR